MCVSIPSLRAEEPEAMQQGHLPISPFSGFAYLWNYCLAVPISMAPALMVFRMHLNSGFGPKKLNQFTFDSQHFSMLESSLQVPFREPKLSAVLECDRTR